MLLYPNAGQLLELGPTPKMIVPLEQELNCNPHQSLHLTLIHLLAVLLAIAFHNLAITPNHSSPQTIPVDCSMALRSPSQEPKQ
ncbi:hypothetical protein H6F72_13690 [Trichocoleus sp. FACHB-46]|nr:hypothetical protein [Trichocoleus sp. FACHB-46]